MTSFRCHAPHVAMEFGPIGEVQACCANVFYPLGNVRHMSLEEIWDGPRASALRAAVDRGDLALGCGICRHRDEHHEAERPWEIYDRFEVEPGGSWPARLSFQLHNTCNLECVMCGADRSSRIRSRREHLAPLPHVYGDDFFAQLEPFLAHAQTFDFNGGEPFLITEHHRVWDMLEVIQPGAPCSATTNGTVWNERVERVLARFPTDILLSMDGATATTFEAVRVGASHARVLENLGRFRRYAAERGTWLGLSWSLVQQNWFELADFVLWAEDLGLPVIVQTVIDPQFGLQRGDDELLHAVLRSWSERRQELDDRLRLNRDVFARQVQMIEAEVERRHRGTATELYMEPPSPDAARAVVEDILEAAPAPDPHARRLAEQHLEQFAAADLSRIARGRITVDPTGAIVDRELDEVDQMVLATPGASAGAMEVPDDLWSLIEGYCRRIGGHLWTVDALRAGSFTVHTVAIGAVHRDKNALVIRLASLRVADGIGLLVHADDIFLPVSGTPVRLST